MRSGSTTRDTEVPGDDQLLPIRPHSSGLLFFLDHLKLVTARNSNQKGSVGRQKGGSGESEAASRSNNLNCAAGRHDVIVKQQERCLLMQQRGEHT